MCSVACVDHARGLHAKRGFMMDCSRPSSPFRVVPAIAPNLHTSLHPAAICVPFHALRSWTEPSWGYRNSRIRSPGTWRVRSSTLLRGIEAVYAWMLRNAHEPGQYTRYALAYTQTLLITEAHLALFAFALCSTGRLVADVIQTSSSLRILVKDTCTVQEKHGNLWKLDRIKPISGMPLL